MCAFLPKSVTTSNKEAKHRGFEGVCRAFNGQNLDQTYLDPGVGPMRNEGPVTECQSNAVLKLLF